MNVSLRLRFVDVVYYMAGSSTAKNLPDCTHTAFILVDVVFMVSGFIRKICKVLNGVEITVIKLASLEDSTLKVKFLFWWPSGDQLFRFSRQRIFLGAKIYGNNKV